VISTGLKKIQRWQETWALGRSLSPISAFAAVAVVCAFSACAKAPAPEVAFHGARLPAYAFRPETPVADLLERAIDASTVSIRVAVYELDLEPLSRALLRAAGRGARVAILLNEGALFPVDDEGRPAPVPNAIRSLMASQAEVRVLRGTPPYGSMHTKFAVLDGILVIDGSYNWTAHSEARHYEDVQILFSTRTAAAFSGFWSWMWGLSLPASEVLERGPGGPYPPWGDAPPRDSELPVRFADEKLPAYVFSPGGGGLDLLARCVRASRRRIDVAMFSFYAFQVAGPLVGAHLRGVRLRVLLDQDQAQQTPILAYLLRHGVPVRLLPGPGGPGPHSRMHHKFALFDGALLASGSYNWSPNAERRSFETLRLSDDRTVIGGFAAHFESMWRRASPAALGAASKK